MTTVKEKILQISIFKDVSRNPTYVDQLVQYLKPSSISKNSTIIQEGDIGENMYILVKGSIEIQKSTLSKQPYTVTKLDDSQNIYFGELALIDSDKRSATVIAIEDCELLSLSRNDFLEMGNRYPELGWNILRQIASVLSSRLRKANEDSIVLFEALVNEIYTS